MIFESIKYRNTNNIICQIILDNFQFDNILI